MGGRERERERLTKDLNPGHGTKMSASLLFSHTKSKKYKCRKVEKSKSRKVEKSKSKANLKSGKVERSKT